jgi:hypothetical protein
MEPEMNLEQDVRDLAAALESVIAAALIAEREPETALKLLRAARDMAAAIRTGSIEHEPELPTDRPDA